MKREHVGNCISWLYQCLMIQSLKIIKVADFIARQHVLRKTKTTITKFPKCTNTVFSPILNVTHIHVRTTTNVLSRVLAKLIFPI